MQLAGLYEKNFVLIVMLMATFSCRSSSRYESREADTHASKVQTKAQWSVVSKQAMVIIWHMYPEQASLLDMHSYDPHLPTRNPTRMKQEVDQLSRLIQKLYAIPDASLSPDQKLDRQLISARLRLAVQEIAVEARPLHDPFTHIETLKLALTSLWLNLAQPLPQRLADMSSRLLKTPVFLNDALQNLHHPDPILCQAAQKEATQLILFLQRDLHAQALRSEDDLKQALELGISEASRGLEHYRQGLQKICPREQKLFALGQVAFRQRMALEHGLYWGPDAVRTEARRWMSRANRMLKLNQDPQQPNPTVDVTQKKKQTNSTWSQSISSHMSNLKLLSVQNHLFHLPSEKIPQLSTVCKLNQARVKEFYMWPQVTTHNQTQGTVLLDGLWTAYSNNKQAEQGNDLLHNSALALSLARETYPGRLALHQHSRANSSKVRDSFITTSLDAGWGLYAEDLALKFGLVNNDATAQQFFWQSLRNTAALAIVDVGIHSKQMNKEDALSYLREHSDLPGAVLMSVSNDRETYLNQSIVDILAHPTQASANLLAYAAIEGMRQRLQNLRGASFNLQAFHDAVLSHGQIPPAYLSALIFHDPLPELDPFFPPAPLPNQAKRQTSDF